MSALSVFVLGLLNSFCFFPLSTRTRWESRVFFKEKMNFSLFYFFSSRFLLSFFGRALYYCPVRHESSQDG
jgi:hypothetical protein